MTTMQSLFDEHAGLAFSRQLDLASHVTDSDWKFDKLDGTITFTGPDRSTIASACQILGTESEAEETWMWGWANTQSGIPAGLLRAAESLRALGAAAGIAELTAPVIPIADWDGHRIAMIAAGRGDCAGYYRAPYPGGALFVLLTGKSLITPVDQPVLRCATTLPALLRNFAVADHRLAARGLARGLGLAVAGDDDLSLSGPDGELRVSFDFLGRLAKLEGTGR